MERLQQIPRTRAQGDGATSIERTYDNREHTSQVNLFTVNVKINIMQVILFLISLVTRLYKLGYPNSVVFDELHFTRFVSLYMKRVFFFDFNPPLGKLIFVATANFLGYSCSDEYDRIGAEYTSNTPVYHLRLVPALCSSLLVPMVYQIVVEIGLSHWSALCAAILILFDTAIVVQSRFILLEAILMFFMAASLLSLLRFRRLANRPFTAKWCFYLILTGVFLAAAISTKYIGAMTGVLVLYIVTKDYWTMLADVSKNNVMLIKELAMRLACLCLLPCAVYLSVFYVHLSLLTKAGLHDNVMSSAFQASLEGGLASITKGQPLNIAYGSQITLRHADGRPCWLHSHVHLYPIKYESQLGSSHQQQVTCYYFKDVNNWWIVKHPDRNQLMTDDPPQPVRNGDIIQLVHGMTHRALNTHDVAAPVSVRCQEVSCYIDYNVSMHAQNLWRVEITNGNSASDKWETIKGIVKLIHVNTSAALRVTGKHLPDWGFKQLEVVADRDVTTEGTVWNVEEHRYSKTDSNEKIDLSHSELIPTEPTSMSFWAKFLELHTKLFHHDGNAVIEHRYSSSPLEWFFVTRNLAYWLSPDSNAQIHLVGNPVLWYAASMSVCVSVAVVIRILYYHVGNPVLWYAASMSVCVSLAVVIVHLMRRRRKHFDLPDDTWRQYILTLEMGVLGYSVHILPYLLTDHTLFMYHYIPLVMYKVIALVAVAEHAYSWICRHKTWRLCFHCSVFAYLTVVFWAFVKLSPLTYGSPALAQDIRDLQWKESWEFIIHK